MQSNYSISMNYTKYYIHYTTNKTMKQTKNYYLLRTETTKYTPHATKTNRGMCACLLSVVGWKVFT